jgi:hypothetical protein
MPNRKISNKHPALALKDLKAKQDLKLNGIKETEIWSNLNWEEKAFLGFYLVYRDAKRASQNAGLSLTWMEDHERKNPDFRRIVEAVLEHPRSFAQEMALEAAPLATQISINMMQDSTNKATQLNALKHIHALAGMIQSDQPMQGQFVNVNLAVPWETGNNQVVEGEVVDNAD